jgi:hypothetical protein
LINSQILPALTTLLLIALTPSESAVRKKKQVLLQGAVPDLANMILTIVGWEHCSSPAAELTYSRLLEKLRECKDDWVHDILPLILRIMGSCFNRYVVANGEILTHAECKLRVEALEHVPLPKAPQPANDRAISPVPPAADPLGFDTFLFSPPPTAASAVPPPTILPSALLATPEMMPDLAAGVLTYPLPISPNPKLDAISSWPRILAPHVADPRYSNHVLSYLERMQAFPHDSLRLPLLLNHLNVRADQLVQAVIASRSTDVVLALLKFSSSSHNVTIGALITASLSSITKDSNHVEILTTLLSLSLPHYDHTNLAAIALSHLKSLPTAEFIPSLRCFLEKCPRVFQEKQFGDATVSLFNAAILHATTYDDVSLCVAQFLAVAGPGSNGSGLVASLAADFGTMKTQAKENTLSAATWILGRLDLAEFNDRFTLTGSPDRVEKLSWDWLAASFIQLLPAGGSVLENLYKIGIAKPSHSDSSITLMLTLSYTVYKAQGDLKQLVTSLERARELKSGRERTLEIVYKLLADGEHGACVAVFSYLNSSAFSFLTGIKKGLVLDGSAVVGSGRSLVAHVLCGCRSSSAKVRVAALRCAGVICGQIDSRSPEAQGIVAVLKQEGGSWKEQREKADALFRLMHE